MKVYEVLYQIMLISGDTELKRITLESVSPKNAKRCAYNIISQVKPTASKTKFMYVRETKKLRQVHIK